jgi:peptide/nickel transport system substrate-binding protein
VLGKLLISSRGFAAFVALATVVAACGGDSAEDSEESPPTPVESVGTETSESSDTSETSETSESSETSETSASSETSADESFDPEGILTTGWDLEAGGGMTFSPWGISDGRPQLQVYLYGTLLKNLPDGSFGPGLAEGVEVIDTTTLEVVLRPDLVFSDGTALDAEAFAKSFMMNVESENAIMGGMHGTIESVEPIDEVTARIHLSSEVAGRIYDLMVTPATFLVSPTAVEAGVDLDTNPVGAGPFVLESFEPGAIARFRKSPSYYAADEVRLAGVDVKHVADGSPAEINGLLSDDTDFQFIGDPSQAGTFDGHDSLETSLDTDTTFTQFYICKRDEPLNDVKVRQALSMAIDRDGLVEIVQDGAGSPSWGLWPPGHVLHNPDIENLYPYDPEQAKELLAEAGYPDGFTLGTFYMPGAPERMAELVQAQWAEIGVGLELAVSTDYFTDFFVNANEPLFLGRQGGLGAHRVSNFYLPGAAPNVCQYDDPELTDLMNELFKVESTGPEGIKLWQQIQEIVARDLLGMHLTWFPTLHAWNTDRVAGVVIGPGVQGRSAIDWTSLYVPA